MDKLLKEYISELRDNWIPRTKMCSGYNHKGDYKEFESYFDEHKFEYTPNKERAFEGYVFTQIRSIMSYGQE